MLTRRNSNGSHANLQEVELVMNVHILVFLFQELLIVHESPGVSLAVVGGSGQYVLRYSLQKTIDSLVTLVFSIATIYKHNLHLSILHVKASILIIHLYVNVTLSFEFIVQAFKTTSKYCCGVGIPSMYPSIIQ